MARKKVKGSRKGASTRLQALAPSTTLPTSAPTASSLIDKAHTLLAQSNFQLAIKFLERACELEPDNAEARELLGIAELEAGDEHKGRQHLLLLFPPHTLTPPTSPAPYLYLAQSASDPQEALGYYSAAVSMVEQKINKNKGKGKMVGLVQDGDLEGEEAEERKMAINALVAMIEIWMSDLCFEEAASSNCDALIARALSISPTDPEARLSLASIRMSQSKFDEAKEIVQRLYDEIEGRESFDPLLPPLPARLLLSRLLLEHGLHLEALDVLSTVREEDSLEVEGAYLEGWAWYLRADVLSDPSSIDAQTPKRTSQAVGEEDDEEGEMTSAECYSESMRCLIEAGKLIEEQEYPDKGIVAHVQELLKGLMEKGIEPAVVEIGGEDGEGEGGEWEEVDEVGDVEMA